MHAVVREVWALMALAAARFAEKQRLLGVGGWRCHGVTVPRAMVRPPEPQIFLVSLAAGRRGRAFMAAPAHLLVHPTL